MRKMHAKRVKNKKRQSDIQGSWDRRGSTIKNTYELKKYFFYFRDVCGCQWNFLTDKQNFLKQWSPTPSSPHPANFWIWEINILIHLKFKIWGKDKKSFEEIFGQKGLKGNTHKKVSQCNEKLNFYYIFTF